MEELLKKYKDYKEQLHIYRYVGYILYFDSVTDSPLEGREYSNYVQNYFSSKYYDIVLSEDYINLIKELYSQRNDLDEITKLDIEIEYKDIEKAMKIPREELDKHMENTSKCYLEWDKARKSLDFSKFEDELKELVEYNKKYCKWLETENLKGYDVLLDEMEEGYNQKMYDEFFDRIEKDLLPFYKKVRSAKQRYNPKLDTLSFSISKQKELTERIAKIMGYTKERGCIRETTHPFTDWFDNKDIRVTTKYMENLLFSNLYSIIHELGHALFQLQMDDKYNHTNIFNNVTCITHESQSRFYENYLGRSRSFIKYIYPVLMELFKDELEGITEDDIYYYVNSVKDEKIRCEADELSYPFHILTRYNVEKKLISGEITVDQISETFNFYMEKYLGLKPENKLEGCYQDSHWTSSFGYFPTYAVGSAYGAMFLEELKRSVDVDKDLENGNFENINKWLKENIHRYSGTRKNLEVVRNVCHKEFDIDYYISYLIKKFSEIYEI